MWKVDQVATSQEVLSKRSRVAALGGIAGIGGFVSAWAGLGAARSGYSPISDAISRLAEVGAPKREVMNAGFTAFGIGVPLYSLALKEGLPSKAWLSAMVTGLASFGVAATPLGRHDTAHYLFATLGYVTLAAVPLLAASDFEAAGMGTWAKVSRACGIGSAIFMVLSVADPAHGLTQRLGLSITDAWIVVTAWKMWRDGQLIDARSEVAAGTSLS